MGDNRGKNSRIARNTLFLYVRMFFAMVVALYTSRVLLRTLGVVDFGVNNVVAGFVTMFSFLNSSLTGAIQRYYNFEKSIHGSEGVGNVYRASMLIQVSMAVLVFILLEGFGVWYLNNVMVIPEDRLFAANILFQCSTASLFFLILSIPYSAAIMSFEHMDYYAIVGVLDVVLKLGIVLILPYLGSDKLITYSILLFSISVINFLLYFLYARNEFDALRLKGRRDKGLLKSMLVFSGWNFFGTFSNVVYQQGVNLLLNYFFGPVVNAARGISAYVSHALHGFSSNIVVAFRPQMVESYAEKNYTRTKNIMYSESKICYLMLLIFIVPIVIEVDYVLHLWLGDEVPDFSAIFTVLVLIKMLITTLNMPFTQIVHASGIMKKFQIITGGITCMIIPLGWLAFKIGLSPVSIFVIALFLAVATQLACNIIVKQFFDYDVKRYLTKVILPILSITVLSPILPMVIHLSMPESFLRLVCVTLVSVIIIIIYSYFVILSKEERALALAMISKWKEKIVKS